MLKYPYQFLIALLITSIVELLVLLLIWTKTRETFLKNIRFGRLLFLGLFGSLLTLPYIWFVFYNVIGNRTIFVIISECFAIVVEAVIYRMGLSINLCKSFLLSGTCNFLSFFMGILYNSL